MEAAAITIPTASPPVRTVIEPERGFAPPNMREVWEYRDLLALLIRRNVTVRYKQTAAGALWAIVQPLALAVVFSVFMGILAKVPSQGDIPYPLFAFTGMAMWLYISNALTASAQSLVGAADLITKVYFPRIILPVSAVIAAAVDFCFAFAVVVVAMLAYGEPLHPQIVLIPTVLVLAMLASLAGGLWLSALNVRFRDVQNAVPFVILLGLFCTPIIYSFDLIPDHLQWIYGLNPAVGVLELYRWMLFGELTAPLWVVAIPIATSIVSIFLGTLYFRRAERAFADVV
jgi:lipopolysaccharide transport system permease protein